MTGFATYQDLEKRLNRRFEKVEEQEWINELLEDASAHLRAVIGQEVYPQRTVTFTDVPTAGRVGLPQAPVVSIDTVVRGNAPVPYKLGHGYLLVDGDEPVTVTYTYGAKVPPRELTRITCVLVSQTLLTLEQQLGLTAGGLSSVAIDDFKIAFANGGEQTGMTLTPFTVATLRQQFGRGHAQVGEATL